MGDSVGLEEPSGRQLAWARAQAGVRLRQSQKVGLKSQHFVGDPPFVESVLHSSWPGGYRTSIRHPWMFACVLFAGSSLTRCWAGSLGQRRGRTDLSYRAQPAPRTDGPLGCGTAIATQKDLVLLDLGSSAAYE